MARSESKTATAGTDVEQTTELSVDTADDVDRGVIATADDSADERILASKSPPLTNGLAEDSIPPGALADLSPGDRIHIGRGTSTYTVQYSRGGIVSECPSTVHLTRDSDGASFSLTVSAGEYNGTYKTEVQFVVPRLIRCGRLVESDTVLTVNEICRVGRGNPAQGPGREFGIFTPV